MTNIFIRIKEISSKHPLITGSFFLTLAGFLSRFIGFFYRIYLSQIFGEEGMGIYQLISPVMAMSFSLTAAGFQTSISKFVAECTMNVTPNKKYFSSCRPLVLGLSISLPLSFLLTFVIINGSSFIATTFLQEPRTASLLRILALSLPLSAAHACINGYFYGLKKASVPSICQLIEQLSRVLSVYVITSFCMSQGSNPTLNVTVIGLVIGELISTLVCIIVLLQHIHTKQPTDSRPSTKQYTPIQQKTVTYGMLLGMALPLIANRITLNLLQSIETVSLPSKLRLFGYDSSTALSVYGVLTGMAFPLLFFPNAVTGSFAVLLLPLISERISVGDTAGVKKLTAKTVQYCSLLGFTCMSVFFLFGNSIGIHLFHSELAGLFIRALSFICPFLYLNNTLSAILQGMGKVFTLFFTNITALIIRLLFIYTFVPSHGIQGYLWGLLTGQIFQSSIYLLSIILSKKIRKN